MQDHCPVMDSFRGIADALEKELECTTPTRLSIDDVQGEPDALLLTVQRPSAKLLKEEMENYTAAGERDSQHRYPWVGEVTAVDTDHGSIVIHRTTGDQLPQPGSHIFLYPPDYQLVLRMWATNNSSNDLPDYYRRGVDQRILEDRSLFDLGSVACADTALRAAQRSAVLATGRNFSVIWGPPGTGKTFTLGAAVAAHASSGIKVLVVAPTNSAIDQAVVSIDNAFLRCRRPLREGELIRPGRPQLSELEARPHLLAWTRVLSQMSQAILAIRKDVYSLERERTRSTDERRAAINVQLGKLKKTLTALETTRAKRLWELANHAKIIATTVISAICHPEVLDTFRDRKTSLFLDEASMISRAAFVRLCNEPFDHLAIFGDPKQLSPIKKNGNRRDENAAHWIGCSVFDSVRASTDDEIVRLEQRGNLVMLNEQSRMHSDICARVSRTFYMDRLATVDGPQDPPLISDWPQSCLMVVDARKLSLPDYAPAESVDQTVDLRNHRYEKSAWIALDIAREFLNHRPEGRVLLMSPFRNQADLLRKLVRAHLSHFQGVTAGTIHVCQGQEADLVLFDPVQPGHPWLRGDYGEAELKQLICVAFSRPRVQLVAFGLHSKINQNPLFAKFFADAPEWRPAWLAADTI